ncbi:hypothetical protein BDR26DRAFT_1008330 [Obelidium mucronatum]|nr:hypothetical protein BDR26DRAFT_1008330 [Obelidium mucronatum]
MSLTAKHSPAQNISPTVSTTTNNTGSSLSAIATSNLAATNAAGPLTAALIKEYLAARGLNKTLDAFKLEFLQYQKTPPISSRQELADQLGISKLIKQNKAQDQPLKTQIEIIVKYLVSRSQKDLPAASSPTSGAKVSSASRLRTGQTSASPKGATETQKILSNQQTLQQLTEPLDAPSSIIFKTPLGGFSATNPRAVSAASNRVTPSTTTTRPSTGVSPKRGTSATPSITSTEKTITSQSAPKTTVAFSRESKVGFTGPTKTALTGLDLSSSEDELDQNVNSNNNIKFNATNNNNNNNSNNDIEEEEMSGQLEGFRKSSKVPNGVQFAPSSKKPTSSGTVETTINDDLHIMDDFDDDEYSITSDLGGSLSNQHILKGSTLAGSTAGGTLISTQKAYMLRKLVFPGAIGGSEESRAKGMFTEEWKGKGFCFSSNTELAYGTVQIKGGPCGLLASVQAYILKHLLFVEKAHNIRVGKLRPGIAQCQTALIDALSEILWQAGGTRHRRAVVAIYNPNLRVNASVNLHREKYTPDGITENMQLFEFYDVNQLRAFLTANISTFTVNDPNRHGLIQLLYSVILSRGPETIREEDFDELDCSMIGRHGYCTQEMVNLILMGQAISNVHDGDFKLGEGADVKILKGMKKTCQFGYLSLFEHYGSLKVGEYYKSPTLPIFVICSESHFTVLFSLDKDIMFKTGHQTRLQDKLELFYYDGLANQDGEISLEIVLGDGGKKKRLGGGGGGLPTSDTGSSSASDRGGDSLTPPLELVLKTRWPDISKVTWRGSDPLL